MLENPKPPLRAALEKAFYERYSAAQNRYVAQGSQFRALELLTRAEEVIKRARERQTAYPRVHNASCHGVHD